MNMKYIIKNADGETVARFVNEQIRDECFTSLTGSVGGQRLGEVKFGIKKWYTMNIIELVRK